MKTKKRVRRMVEAKECVYVMPQASPVNSMKKERR